MSELLQEVMIEIKDGRGKDAKTLGSVPVLLPVDANAASDLYGESVVNSAVRSLGVSKARARIMALHSGNIPISEIKKQMREWNITTNLRKPGKALLDKAAEFIASLPPEEQAAEIAKLTNSVE